MFSFLVKLQHLLIPEFVELIVLAEMCFLDLLFLRTYIVKTKLIGWLLYVTSLRCLYFISVLDLFSNSTFNSASLRLAISASTYFPDFSQFFWCSNNTSLVEQRERKIVIQPNHKKIINTWFLSPNYLLHVFLYVSFICW